MDREPQFKEWDDYHQRVWNSTVPGLMPRLHGLVSSNDPALENCDFVTGKIIEEGSMYDDEHVVYVDKENIHSDALVQGHIHNRLKDYFINGPYSFVLKEKCPYCGIMLYSWQQEEHNEDVDSDFMGALETCPNCSYWEWNYLEHCFISRPDLTVYAYTHFIGKFRTFDEIFPEGCAQEIATWIRRNPKRWHSINPTKLEQLVADIFRANDSHVEVSHVGRPDDGGVDVIYIDAEKKQWLIQVKRREKPQSVEAVETIRNLLGTMVLENSAYGAVVSTADHFSYQAYKAVNRAKDRGMVVRLLDRRALDHMLTGLLVDRPWLKPLYPIFPEFIDQLLAYIPSNHRKRPKLF